MSRRWGWTLAALAVAVGCGSTYDYDSGYGRFTWSSSYSSPPSAAKQPALELDDATIDMRLAEHEQAQIRRNAVLAELPGQASSLADSASAVQSCYRERGRERAEELIAANPDVYAWDQATQVVEISTVFRSSGVGGAIELTLERRPGVTGPLAVAIPPGTYGVPAGYESAASGGDPTSAAPEVELAPLAGSDWNTPESQRRFRDWPRPQDLAFMRAPVIVLAEGAQTARARIPVACASFHKGAPQGDTPYTLRTFERGSKVDKLMLAICAGERPPADTEVQLAVWLSRDDISWDQFKAEGGHWGRLVTFGGNRSVLPSHADGASRLMIDAGVDPRALRFYGGSGEAEAARPETSAETPGSVAPAERAPEPAPAAPQPVEPGKPQA